MAIKYIVNKTTCELGYQAIVKNKSRYFSVRKYGKRKAKQMATQAEKELCESFGLTVQQYRSRMNMTAKRKPLGRNKTVGVYLLWQFRKGNNTNLEYASIRGVYQSSNTGKRSIFAFSIHKHGLEQALQLAFARRIQSGFTNPDYNETLQGFKEQLKLEGKGKPYREKV